MNAESCPRTVEQSCFSREGYRADNVISVMQSLDGRLGEVLAITSGYNDPIGTIDTAIDAVIDEAKRQGVGHVVWLSLRTSADVDYQDPQEQSGIDTFRAYNEQLVEAVAASDGDLQVPDWATYSIGATAWFDYDGVHLSPSGVDALTTFLAGSVERVLAGEDVSPASPPWTILVPGAEGEVVASIQQAVVDAGIALRSGIDGLYGNDTMFAVAEYQRRAGELGVNERFGTGESHARRTNRADGSNFTPSKRVGNTVCSRFRPMINSIRYRGVIAGLAVSALLLAACGSDDDDGASDDTSTDDTAAASTDATEETEAADSDAPKLAIVYSAEWFDGSWGEAAYDGATALEASGAVSEISLSENVTPGAEAERAMRALAEDGFNPIIAHSFDFGEDVKAVAADFPDTIFLYAGGFGDVTDNQGDYDQPFYEASYLQGILAAGATDGGAVAGAAGFEIPACYAMYEAFLAGAREIRPDTEGSFIAVGDWYDVQLAKEGALGQANDGATMFVGCGQAPTFGQIEAANDEGGVSTGYVGDMAELGDSVLSSFEWNLDLVFGQAVDDVAAGSNEAQYYGVGLGDGGLEVLIHAGEEGDISDEALALFETRLAEIQNGEFEVPFIPEA